MNIKKTITIELSKSDIQEIIADYLNKDGYDVKPDDVCINMGKKYIGYGLNERAILDFKNITVKCKEK